MKINPGAVIFLQGAAVVAGIVLGAEYIEGFSRLAMQGFIIFVGCLGIGLLIELIKEIFR